MSYTYEELRKSWSDNYVIISGYVDVQITLHDLIEGIKKEIKNEIEQEEKDKS